MCSQTTYSACPDHGTHWGIHQVHTVSILKVVSSLLLWCMWRYRKTAPAPKDEDELPSYDAPPSVGIRMESLVELQLPPPEGNYVRTPLSSRWISLTWSWVIVVMMCMYLFLQVGSIRRHWSVSAARREADSRVSACSPRIWCIRESSSSFECWCSIQCDRRAPRLQSRCGVILLLCQLLHSLADHSVNLISPGMLVADDLTTTDLPLARNSSMTGAVSIDTDSTVQGIRPSSGMPPPKLSSVSGAPPPPLSRISNSRGWAYYACLYNS